jgi:hypothetical protein
MENRASYSAALDIATRAEIVELTDGDWAKPRRKWWANGATMRILGHDVSNKSK